MIPTLERVRQGNCELQANLGYIKGCVSSTKVYAPMS